MSHLLTQVAAAQPLPPHHPDPLFVDDLFGHLAGAGQRMPVTRSRTTEERAPIARWMRVLILSRDGWRCRVGGTCTGPLQVDHITPWSAGGSDLTTNLRALCRQCNADRSNRAWDGHAERVLPIAWWCTSLTPDGMCADAGPVECDCMQVASWCANCHQFGTTPRCTLVDLDTTPAAWCECWFCTSASVEAAQEAGR
jgi:HNH endonuclease